METVSPSADRIGAALRALRKMHGQDPEDKASLGIKCLHAVITQLAAEGVSAEDLQPLADLDSLVRDSKTKPVTPSQRERRRSLAPSPILLARAAAVIDLLVKSGQEESEAAQAVMRRMVIAGVPPPTQGGDARGWRRLLEWRNHMLQGFGPDDTIQEYKAFAREIEAIPPGERVARVLDERLWDRRRSPR